MIAESRRDDGKKNPTPDPSVECVVATRMVATQIRFPPSRFWLGPEK